MLTESYITPSHIQNYESHQIDQSQQSTFLQQHPNLLNNKQLTSHAAISFSNQSQQQTILILEKEGAKKQLQNKFKYKKLKQKLVSLSQQILDQGLFKDQKDITSPNKSRLMKLALEFQRSLKTQAIDYSYIQSILREIQKIVQYKRQHDILILRGARFMSTLLALMKRYPSLHKTQALQSLISLQQSLKLLHSMLSLASSRQYLLVSNQLSVISTLLNCSLMKQQKKIAVQCLVLLNLIFIGPIRIQLDQLIKLNIQYMLCSSLLKRFKMFIQACLEEDDPSHSQFLLLGFKFHYLIIKKSCQNELQRPIYQCNFMSNLTKTMINYFQHVINMLVKSVINFIYQKQQEDLYVIKDDQIPNFKINILLFIFKTFNIIFHVDVSFSQKYIQCNQHFMNSLLFILKYVKQNFKQNQQITNLCSQIIIFLGNLAFENINYQDLIREKGLLQQLCNHPLDYMMQPLKYIFIPSICCIIHLNDKNLSKTFSQNSVSIFLQFIQKQISNVSDRKNEQQIIFDFNKQLHSKALSRKTSVSSISSKYSMAQSFSTQTSGMMNKREKHLDYKFRPSNWECLIKDLQKYDD